MEKCLQYFTVVGDRNRNPKPFIINNVDDLKMLSDIPDECKTEEFFAALQETYTKAKNKLEAAIANHCGIPHEKMKAYVTSSSFNVTQSTIKQYLDKFPTCKVLQKGGGFCVYNLTKDFEFFPHYFTAVIYE